MDFEPHSKRIRSTTAENSRNTPVVAQRRCFIRNADGTTNLIVQNVIQCSQKQARSPLPSQRQKLGIIRDPYGKITNVTGLQPGQKLIESPSGLRIVTTSASNRPDQEVVAESELPKMAPPYRVSSTSSTQSVVLNNGQVLDKCVPYTMADKLDTSKDSSIPQTMEILYSEKDETGDVTFIVGSESIRAHRCVMAALSPKYKAQFYGPKSDRGTINVTDISASAFKEFLQLFYLENVSLSEENIAEVLNLAKQSLVDDFVTRCANYLMKTINVENVCLIYGLAILYEMEELKESCEQHVMKNASKLFGTDEFIECDYNVLVHILMLDSLNCKETEVFKACIAWAIAACNSKNIDVERMENLRTELGDVVYQIRFCSMSANEFTALHRAYEGLFSPDESLELFYIVTKLENFKSQRFNQKLRCIELSETN